MIEKKDERKIELIRQAVVAGLLCLVFFAYIPDWTSAATYFKRLEAAIRPNLTFIPVNVAGSVELFRGGDAVGALYQELYRRVRNAGFNQHC